MAANPEREGKGRDRPWKSGEPRSSAAGMRGDYQRAPAASIHPQSFVELFEQR
jgi:hypothetical protein